MTSMKHVIPPIFFLLFADTGAQSNMTGNTIITDLNTLNLSYQDRTQLAVNFHKSPADNGQQLVEQYADITAAHRQNAGQ